MGGTLGGDLLVGLSRGGEKKRGLQVVWGRAKGKAVCPCHRLHKSQSFICEDAYSAPPESLRLSGLAVWYCSYTFIPSSFVLRCSFGLLVCLQSIID